MHSELALYRTMTLIREFEEYSIDIYKRGHLPGLVHASSGQEAVSAGVISVLAERDYLTSTHRGHGHCIARGVPVDAVMLEIMGRVDGCCRGKGGSMHVADFSRGMLGANGIVGGGAGIALGAAFSAKYRGSDAVSVVFLGDGSMNQGVVAETMNMAALWQLPLIYVCENNGVVEYSRLEEVAAGRLVNRARPYGIPSFTVDGQDVATVVAATTDAVERARRGDGPTYLDMATFRYHGHHVAETDHSYRLDHEIDEWRKKDPLLILADRLLSAGIAEQADLDEITAAAAAEVRASHERSRQAPEPDMAELYTGVYA
ncbi:thiamine pyrophosphate-dependent dehydrogenase E1 component subunit alpha [Dactylosporangium sp. NPDC050688]|uniref:thiamine pyrophosphate-dependent dehydrogenase E1 component subunit alpha n=1 Tax=Dactylosporangium sp. NPDC050688 TaxID=3157217 RepID=UPI0033C156DA